MIIRALSSFSIISSSPALVSRRSPRSRSPIRLRRTRCTAYPLPAASSSRTEFTNAHTMRCSRPPLTHCPLTKRNRCCACSARVNCFVGHASNKSPTPIRSSSGKAFAKRPFAQSGVGSSATPGHPTTCFPAALAATCRAFSSASMPSGTASIVPVSWPIPKCSDTARNSSRMKSASSSSSAASSAPNAAPTLCRHHFASASTVKASFSPSSFKSRHSPATFSKKSAGTSSPRALNASSSPSAPGAKCAHQRPSALPKGGSLSAIHLQNTSLSTSSADSPVSPCPRLSPGPSTKPTCRPVPNSSAAVRASADSIQHPLACNSTASSGVSTSPCQTFGAYRFRMSASSNTSNSFLSYHLCIGPMELSRRHRPSFVSAFRIRDTTSHRISKPSSTCPCPMFRRNKITKFLRSFFGCQGMDTRGFTSRAHSTAQDSLPLQWSYSSTKRPSASTLCTVAGKTRQPCSSFPNRSLSSGLAVSHFRSGRATSRPGPRREFTRSPTRYSSGPSISMRTAKRAMSCGNEIVFFLNFSSPVFATLTIDTCMCSRATNIASVTVADANSSPSSLWGKFQHGSMWFR